MVRVVLCSGLRQNHVKGAVALAVFLDETDFFVAFGAYPAHSQVRQQVEVNHPVAVPQGTKPDISDRRKTAAPPYHCLDPVAVHRHDTLVLGRIGPSLLPLAEPVAEIPDTFLAALDIQVDNRDLLRTEFRQRAARL